MRRLALALALVLLPASSAGAAGDLFPHLLVQVSVEEDETVFTLFALLNAAGYDRETSAAGMHPVRRKVRAALANLPVDLKKKIRAFAARRLETDIWNCAVVALSTSGAPDFTPKEEWEALSGDPAFAPLAPLMPLLKEFYARAHIAQLYKSVRADYLAYIKAQDAAVERERAVVQAYMGREGMRMSTVSTGVTLTRIVPNLLGARDGGFTFFLSFPLVRIEGPQTRIGYDPHEFVHGHTYWLSAGHLYKGVRETAMPLLVLARRKLGTGYGHPYADLRNIAPDLMFATARQKYGDTGGALQDLESFFDECLARAISLRYRAWGAPGRLPALEREMLKEWREGWVLERFFWEQLARYEVSGEILDDFYPQMMAALDAKAELARWEAATAKPRD